VLVLVRLRKESEESDNFLEANRDKNPDVEGTVFSSTVRTDPPRHLKRKRAVPTCRAAEYSGAEFSKNLPGGTSKKSVGHAELANNNNASY